MNYNYKVLRLQDEFGISNKKMAEMMGISVQGYSQKRSGHKHHKFTGENWGYLMFNFDKKYKECIKQ